MASSSSAAGAAAAVEASSPKICFNTHCKGPITGPPRRRGWSLRSGELADLCDSCSSTYEQGSFCETFHSNGDGWRKCESCSKRVHCGCIVSIATFMLLDAGGIECIACAHARKNFVMAPYQMWQPSLVLPLPPGRLKDLSGKSWSQHTATSPVLGHQAPNLWTSSAAQSELHQRLSYEFDRPNGTDRLISGGHLTIPQNKKIIQDIPERVTSDTLNRSAAEDRIVNGNTAFEYAPEFNTFNTEEGNVDGSQNFGHLVGETDRMSTGKGVILGPCLNSSSGINFEADPNSCVNISFPSSSLKDDRPAPLIGLAAPFPHPNDANDPARVSATQPRQQTSLPSLAKQFYPNAHNAPDSSGELQTQIRNGRPGVEGRGRNQLLSRYWPRITDLELQQISGDSNSVITPLFEKILSASDASRTGRLVLPKKCAEAFFPKISQSEGVPLKVQDSRGKEWVFQFRFWPNNNSRMYVLEGVTPCIQSMQLEAGDTVTFSRIDPEGKLVMGFRKASNVPTEQDIQALKARKGYSTAQEVDNRNSKPGENISSPPLCPFKGSTESMNLSSPSDQTTWSKFDKTGFIQKEGTASKSSVFPSKRKNSTLGSKSKRLRIENEDSIELKLTWEKAQELLRPPSNHVPSVVVIEGHEFEEYEEAPVLGKPTIFSMNQSGSRKQSKAKLENDSAEADGLDNLADLAIMGEGEFSPLSAQPTTKHPCHRPGCTCIVCIQPPSGKGPKHPSRHANPMPASPSRAVLQQKCQSEREAEAARKKQQQQIQFA